LVGVHGALVALLGLSFLFDPCGGGGDLCLGGVVGLMALAVAGFGAIGIAAWRFGRRASPLLVLDCLLIAVLGPSAVAASGYGPANLTTSGLMVIVLLALVGAALAGRAVASHPVEAILALVIMAGLATQRDAGGVGVLVIGVIALVLGRVLARTLSPVAVGAPPSATEVATPRADLPRRPPSSP
jgi:hypothetical protein